MSIWGKIVGGVAGFAVGGPLGALLGAVAGHAVDRMRDGGAFGRLDDVLVADRAAERQVAFTVGVVTLAAKMAKADGAVSRAEIDAFKRVFRIPPHEMSDVGRLFDAARKDSAGYEPYARQLAEMFADSPAVLEELLDALFAIAEADGALHPAEQRFIERVAEIFGLAGAGFARAQAAQGSPSDAYAVLGVAPDAGADDIKAAYRRLSRENHPDALTAKGMPAEFIEIATRKMAAINAAYDQLRKQRNFA